MSKYEFFPSNNDYCKRNEFRKIFFNAEPITTTINDTKKRFNSKLHGRIVYSTAAILVHYIIYKFIYFIL